MMLPDVLPGIARQKRCILPIGKETPERCTQCFYVPLRHQEAGSAMGDHFGDTAALRPNDRAAGELRL